MSEVNKVFGRVNKATNEVIEYPVYPIHITNRAHPMHWYTEAVVKSKPELPKFHYYSESVKYNAVEDVIEMTYTVTPYSLQHLLNEIHQKKEPLDITGTSTIDVYAQEIDPELLQHCVFMFKEIAQSKLDAFALSRGYDNIISLVSYISSTDEQCVKEAKLGISLRDTTWGVFKALEPELMSGNKPLPKTVEEITFLLPEYTWGDI